MQLRDRPLACFAVMAALLGAAIVYHLRVDGPFACDGSRYEGGRYFLAYCNAVAYLNYDQGAFWYQLEEEAYEHARNADVLFVGNSKVQFALSTEETRDWFADRSMTYYLFGFAHNETMDFFEPLLERMQPRAKAIVVHVDGLFDDLTTPPMQLIREDPSAERVFRTKRVWQTVHGLICGLVPGACGRKFGLHREVETGHWLFTGSEGYLDEPVSVGIAEPDPLDEELWPRRLQRAHEFIASLPVDRGCVFLTLIPSQRTRQHAAETIAASLGMPLISPPMEGLKSFDRTHLDQRSASAWSKMFLTIAGDAISRCVAGSDDQPRLELASE